MSFEGLMHIHSRYSYDGFFSLEELSELSKSRGYNFIVLTDHADDFDGEKMISLVNGCKRLSDKDFIFVPGLEFTCEGMHILAIGIKEFILESDLIKLIDEIHKKGGIAVLAHAVIYKKIPYEKLKNIDGVEVWNTRYEGRFSPSLKSLGVLKSFRKKNKEVLAYCGLDGHKKNEFGKIFTVIDTNELSQENILKALNVGRFYSSNNIINFNSRNDLSILKLAFFYVIRVPYNIGKVLRKIISITLNKIGIKPPEVLSNLIKRVF